MWEVSAMFNGIRYGTWMQRSRKIGDYFPSAIQNSAFHARIHPSPGHTASRLSESLRRERKVIGVIAWYLKVKGAVKLTGKENVPPRKLGELAKEVLKLKDQGCSEPSNTLWLFIYRDYDDQVASWLLFNTRANKWNCFMSLNGNYSYSLELVEGFPSGRGGYAYRGIWTQEKWNWTKHIMISSSASVVVIRISINSWN